VIVILATHFKDILNFAVLAKGSNYAKDTCRHLTIREQLCKTTTIDLPENAKKSKYLFVTVKGRSLKRDFSYFVNNLHFQRKSHLIAEESFISVYETHHN
jgi:hypothetical protein